MLQLIQCLRTLDTEIVVITLPIISLRISIKANDQTVGMPEQVLSVLVLRPTTKIEALEGGYASGRERKKGNEVFPQVKVMHGQVLVGTKILFIDQADALLLQSLATLIE